MSLLPTYFSLIGVANKNALCMQPRNAKIFAAKDFSTLNGCVTG
jgi:hypothetical protein